MPNRKNKKGSSTVTLTKHLKVPVHFFCRAFHPCCFNEQLLLSFFMCQSLNPFPGTRREQAAQLRHAIWRGGWLRGWALLWFICAEMIALTSFSLSLNEHCIYKSACWTGGVGYQSDSYKDVCLHTPAQITRFPAPVSHCWPIQSWTLVQKPKLKLQSLPKAIEETL